MRTLQPECLNWGLSMSGFFFFKFGAPWLISIETLLKIKSINKQHFHFLNEGMLG